MSKKNNAALVNAAENGKEIMNFEKIHKHFAEKMGYYSVEYKERYHCGDLDKEISIQGDYGIAEIPEDCCIELCHIEGDTSFFGGKSIFSEVPVRVSIVVPIDKMKELL